MTTEPRTAETPGTPLTPEEDERSDVVWDVECVSMVGCCRGCPDCYGEGLGCHNRPAVDLIAAARRLAEPEVAKGEADE